MKYYCPHSGCKKELEEKVKVTKHGKIVSFHCSQCKAEWGYDFLEALEEKKNPEEY